MDHLAVARGHAVGDAAGHFGNGDVMAGERRGARDRKPDHARADHQNLHRVFRPARFPVCFAPE